MLWQSAVGAAAESHPKLGPGVMGVDGVTVDMTERNVSVQGWERK